MLQGANAEAVMWVTMIMALSGVFVAERWQWPPGAWLAAGGATVWALLVLRFAPPASGNVWVPLFLTALAVVGLAHMRKSPAAGLTLTVGMGLAAGVYSLQLGAATPSGLALAVIVTAAAIAGAVRRKQEAALVASWLLACAGLYVLSGQQSSDTWLTPAAVLMAALFLAIQAHALPARGQDGLVPATTGAIAAPFAIGVLSLMRVGPDGALFEAGAYLAVAAAQAAVIAHAGQRAGGLRKLGLAIVPPGFALCACLIAGTSILGPVWAAGLLAASTIGFAAATLRATHPMWSLAALASAAAALVQVGSATALLLGARDAEALALILFALAAPAALIGFAARLFAPRAPWTAATLEAGAIALAFLALVACVRWIATRGAPGDMFVGAPEAGVHAVLWISASALLLVRERAGAFFVRRGAAAALIAFAASVLLLGAAGFLNPWWGRWPTAATGIPVLNALAPAYAAPAVAFAGLAWFAQRRGWPNVRIAAGAFAALAGGLWLALETRRAFHGADLSAGGVFQHETLTFSLIGLAAGVALYALRRRIGAFEPAFACLLAGAILIKAALVDVHMPPGDWRAASFVLMALAGAALAIPRNQNP
jgi:hypothetical protein